MYRNASLLSHAHRAGITWTIMGALAAAGCSGDGPGAAATTAATTAATPVAITGSGTSSGTISRGAVSSTTPAASAPAGSPAAAPPSPPVPAPAPTPPGMISLVASSFSVNQGAGTLTVMVNRSGSAAAPASVRYATRDGTARAGTSYAALTGTLQWAANDASAKPLAITVINAIPFSGTQSFGLALSTPSSGAVLGVSGATVTITGDAPATPAALAIRVAGDHFVDGSGSTVQLRGVNVSGLESVAIQGWDPGNPWGGQAGDPTPNWSAIKGWAANVVRLPLNEASWLGLTCVDIGGTAGHAGSLVKADPGGNYQATVAKSVADANAAGLYVILDLHWAAPNDNGTPACPNAQNPMADADHSPAFWTSVANRFKDNPAVIFELFNEPFLDYTALVGNTPWPDLLNGGTVTTFAYAGGAGSKNLTWSTAGMQSLVDAVRATGATNVVLTSTLAWAQQMDGWLKYRPNDPAGQLGAVWHPYPSANYPTQVSCGADGIVTVGEPQCSALEMAAVQAIVAAGYPVVATEFGDAVGGATAPWASVLLPFADAQGVSYLGWTWNPWTFNANVLISDAAGTPSAGFGTYVKAHYRCRAAGTANCP